MLELVFTLVLIILWSIYVFLELSSLSLNKKEILFEIKEEYGIVLNPLVAGIYWYEKAVDKNIRSSNTYSFFRYTFGEGLFYLFGQFIIKSKEEKELKYKNLKKKFNID